MEKTNDLTEGKVVPKLLGFFFPMLFTNLLQQIYSVADTAIVGNGLGDNSLGSVGNLSSMILFIIGFSMGMTNGFSVIIAQDYGAGDTAGVRRAIAHSVKLSGIMSMLLTAAGCIMLRPLLVMMHTDDRLIHDCLVYGYIIFAGLTVTIAYNLCSGILRSLGDSKTPFTAIMISSALNILLDCIFIFVFHTGVEGAAAATVISQGISVLICVIRILNTEGIAFIRDDFDADIKVYVLLLKNGIPMALMNSLTAVGCMVVQGYVNGCGAHFTSAYSVCSKYLNLFMLPSLTAGFAVSSFTGQNFGAGQIGRIKLGVRTCVCIAAVSYLFLGLVMVFLPVPLAGFMLNESVTITLAAEYLRICGISLILLNLLFVFRNTVQGMGHPLIPMLSGIAEMALRIPVIILFLPVIGFRATAYAETAAWIGALVLNFGAYIIYSRRIHKTINM